MATGATRGAKHSEAPRRCVNPRILPPLRPKRPSAQCPLPTQLAASVRWDVTLPTTIAHIQTDPTRRTQSQESKSTSPPLRPSQDFALPSTTSKRQTGSSHALSVVRNNENPPSLRPETPLSNPTRRRTASRDT